MSSSEQNVKCKCEINAEGDCVCTYKVPCASSAPDKTAVWNLECSCCEGTGGPTVRGKFQLRCNRRSDDEGQEEDTFKCTCKCQSCVCRFEVKKAKCCSVISAECDCTGCSQKCGKGQGGCCCTASGASGCKCRQEKEGGCCKASSGATNTGCGRGAEKGESCCKK